ncbi:MAG: hypothetical protein C4523_00555 [Myxococcales bacterium]|nr:MAG: hypothetical protein C4523_00555 [Myxococcales bacterium]
MKRIGKRAGARRNFWRIAVLATALAVLSGCPRCEPEPPPPAPVAEPSALEKVKQVEKTLNEAYQRRDEAMQRDLNE